MPINSTHPLPVNPTTGQQPLASLGGVRVSNGSTSMSTTVGGGVPRETLKELQDVVWSDDEDDPDCLLCAEPLDLSDLNFKPCQCGMQICQFCYNKLLGSDARCPGCRRTYDAKAVVFQPVDWEEVKRAKEKKTRRAKTIKQLTTMGRRHLLGVRVVVKNIVYVIGMKLPASGDESIPILRSHDYFGQYGKISRIYLRDRSSLTFTSVRPLDDDDEDPSTTTGIYIVYIRREDAARAILALDGVPSPSGPPGRYLRATFGTSRYCESFLKGQKCDTHNCHDLHDWGGDSDCFTKDDLELAFTRPADYDARQQEVKSRSQNNMTKAPSRSGTIDDVIGGPALPNSTWGKGLNRSASGSRPSAPIGSSRPVKPTPAVVPPLKSNIAFPLPTPSPVTPQPIKEKKSKSSTAMARGRSSESNQSGSVTTSSAQTSPKKQPRSLRGSTSSKANVPLTPLSVQPPPGLSGTRKGSVATNGESSSVGLPDDLRDESASGDSEAGPSSGSPAPRTPSRDTIVPAPPPPLTADPIIVHSPYEEPQIFHFPASDPAFEFVLGLDDGEVQRQAQQVDYHPSPFNKTLLGLAELGVLAPELPESLPIDTETSLSETLGLFSPFDASGDDIPEQLVETSGQTAEDVEEPRHTSRFHFAQTPNRPSKTQGLMNSVKRGESRESSWHRSGKVNGVLSGYMDEGRQQRSQQRAPSLQGYEAWNNGLTPNGVTAGHVRMDNRSSFSPTSQREREEYDSSSPLSFNAIPTPAGYGHRSSPLDEVTAHGYRGQSPVRGFNGNAGADPRNMGQFSHQRAQSPSPLAHGFRRF